MQNLSRRRRGTKAGTRVIGVSMERSWPQGYHRMGGLHPTPTPHPQHTQAKSMLYAKLVSKNLKNQGKYEGDWGVYVKVLTSGSPHNRRTPFTPPIHSYPHPKNAKSMLCAKLVPKSLEKPRQVREWLGCLWQGIDLKVISKWMDPPPYPTPPITHVRKINIKCKTCPGESGEPRQAQGWLGCISKGLDLRVTKQ